MSEIQIGGRRYSGPAFFSFAFRPLFFSGALFAGIAIPAWACLFTGQLVVAGDPMRWHAHEMLFGFLGAIIGGFLLTAIPNWTGRLPVAGAPLAGLLGLWLLGRIGAVLQATGVIGPEVGIVLELLYWLALSGAAFREIIAGNNKRNLPVVAMIAAFALADIVTFLPDWTSVDPMLGAHLAIALAATLISLIGGRITPSFTRNWLAKEKGEPFPAPFGLIDKAAVAATLIAMLAWAVFPDAAWAGGLLLVAAVVQAIRLARWQGQRTFQEPLVVILHLGYLWLVVGLLALGASAIAPERIMATAALHALTAGAVGTMTLAVMTRASLGHTGRPLVADRGTQAIYTLVILGAVTRVLAPWLPTDYPETVAAAGLLWAAGFLLFAVKYGRYLFSARA
ncbi:NnrS family protein [Dongia sp.]|uniref:NnrS family protein n=1 Tax=Dongia sp. TaxID=1977262 RepID=UPI003751A046